MLSVGVEVTRTTVAVARAEAAEAMEAVRDTLARNGIEERDIKTQFFSISPQYSRPRNGTLEITGYTVSNLLSVTVREIDDVSEVLDDVTAAGGDVVRVNNVSFTVDEPEQYMAQAREQAMNDARARAEQLAELAGVTLGRARSISESTVATPFFEHGGPVAFAAVAEAGPPTPISPGETEVSLMVFVVYELE